MFQYADSSDKYLNTTIGQLNFFKWAIDNNIIKYISEKFDELETAMNSHQKSLKVSRDTPKDTKDTDVPADCSDSDFEQLGKKTFKISVKESFVYFD